jgi:hypothetical protein
LLAPGAAGFRSHTRPGSTGTLVAGGILEQTRHIFSNVRTLLDDLRLDFDDVVKVTVFLASMEDFAAMNGIYAQYFSPPYPARTSVTVNAQWRTLCSHRGARAPHTRYRDVLCYTAPGFFMRGDVAKLDEQFFHDLWDDHK